MLLEFCIWSLILFLKLITWNLSWILCTWVQNTIQGKDSRDKDLIKEANLGIGDKDQHLEA